MFRRAKDIARNLVLQRRKRMVLANGDAPAEWYDDAYATQRQYHTHWSESPYLPVWEAICERLPPAAKILEVGCGPGQLARMLMDKAEPRAYVGFDFSPVAVSLARQNVPHVRVEVADARTTNLYTSTDFGTVICTEVLEHITDDLLVLSRIPAGRQVLATVPDFDWDSHVRHFATRQEVIDRYGHMFHQLEVTEHSHSGDLTGHNGVFFLLNGIRA